MILTKKALKEMIETCSQQLKECGIEHGKIGDIVINTRAKKTYGQCVYKKQTADYTITMMTYLNSFRGAKEVQNTVMHELLHSVKGCMNHGKEWKKVADIVNRKYGYNISRISSLAEEAQEERLKQAKYTLTCECCGNAVASYERRPKITERHYHKSCGVAGKGKLKLVQNM